MAFCVGREEERGVGVEFGEVVCTEGLEDCGLGVEVLHVSEWAQAMECSWRV